jgi:hypothetical protein
MMTVDVAFKGAPGDQKIAAAIFDLMRGHGRFMASDEPIKVSLDSLVEVLSKEGVDASAEKIQAIVKKNPEIFALEEREEVVLVVTTRAGRVPTDRVISTRHTFAERFMKPLPKPEAPPAPPRERPRVAQQWGDISHLIEPYLDQDMEAEAETSIDVSETAAEPGIAVVPQPEPKFIPEPEAEPVVAEAVIEEPVTSRVVRVPAAPAATFTDVDDLALAGAIGDRLRADARIANFGDRWMLEDRVPRFSRGDLRRLKDYITEQEQPLTDEVLAQDVLGGRPGTADFDVLRFAVNFRLSREHRDFDFVGTPNQRFWSTSNLPQIGTTRRKPNEIGSDYRFLLDEAPEGGYDRSVKSIDHVLTFYEYYLGLLPFDEQLQALMPEPVLPNQRTAVLTFETPQSYTTYLVELRYPTPNRGGFILGLDDFYNENLVPGALITIERTENDGHYLVRYVQESSKNARLLELEDRRQRYVFRPTTYACGVIDEYLLSEERFPNFGSEKPLEEKARRRAESIVAATFERLGHKSDGPGFVAGFDELMAAVNIERPFSERYLRSILENDETGAFARDPDGNDAYTYVPGSTS